MTETQTPEAGERVSDEAIEAVIEYFKKNPMPVSNRLIGAMRELQFRRSTDTRSEVRAAAPADLREGEEASQVKRETIQRATSFVRDQYRDLPASNLCRITARSIADRLEHYFATALLSSPLDIRGEVRAAALEEVIQRLNRHRKSCAERGDERGTDMAWGIHLAIESVKHLKDRALSQSPPPTESK